MLLSRSRKQQGPPCGGLQNNRALHTYLLFLSSYCIVAINIEYILTFNFIHVFYFLYIQKTKIFFNQIFSVDGRKAISVLLALIWKGKKNWKWIVALNSINNAKSYLFYSSSEDVARLSNLEFPCADVQLMTATS